MESVRVRGRKYKKDRRRRRSLKQRLNHQKGVLLDELHKAHAERDALVITADNLKKYVQSDKRLSLSLSHPTPSFQVTVCKILSQSHAHT